MKMRKPGSVEDALTIILGKLGRDTCGEVIGRSPSLIYKMADPDHDAQPNMAQAMALDAACMAACGETPLLDYYARKMERTKKQLQRNAEQEAASLSNSVLRLTSHVGQVADNVARFTRADSECGAGLSANERAELAKSHRELKNLTDELDQILVCENTPKLTKY